MAAIRETERFLRTLRDSLLGIVRYHVDLIQTLRNIEGNPVLPVQPGSYYLPKPVPAKGKNGELPLLEARNAINRNLVMEYWRACSEGVQQRCEALWREMGEDIRNTTVVFQVKAKKLRVEVYEMCMSEAAAHFSPRYPELVQDLIRVRELNDNIWVHMDFRPSAALADWEHPAEISKSIPDGKTGDTALPPRQRSFLSNALDVQPSWHLRLPSKNAVLSYGTSYFTLPGWWRQFHVKWLREDVAGGLTCCFMLIPQGMAYAQLAALPPIYGLYTALLPLIVYPLFGTSRVMSLGPTAIISLLTSGGVGRVVPTTSPSYVVLTHAVALLVGIILSITGLLQAGFVLESLLSRPVLHGFTNGAAFVIALSQANHAFGLVHSERTGELHRVLIQVFSNLDSIQWFSVLFFGVCVLLIHSAKKIHKRMPGSFVVLVLATIISWAANAHQSVGLHVVGDVPRGLPVPQLVGDLTPAAFLALLGPAVEIALLIAIENLTIAKTLAGRSNPPDVIGANQELFSVGVANMLTAAFQGYPSAGSFSRSAVNFSTEVHTPFNNWVAAVGVGLALVALTPLFYHIPNAVLASVVVTAAAKLVDFSDAKALWRVSKIEFLQFLTCFLITIFFGAELGILVAVGVSVATVIYRTARPSILELGRLPGTTIYRNVLRYPEAIVLPTIIVIRHDARLYFANIAHFSSTILKVAQRRWGPRWHQHEAVLSNESSQSSMQEPSQETESNELRRRPHRDTGNNGDGIIASPTRSNGQYIMSIVVDANGVNEIDMTAVHVLLTLVETLRRRNTQLLFAQVKGPVLDVMESFGLVEEIGSHGFFLSVHDAVEFAVQGGRARGLDMDRETVMQTVSTAASVQDLNGQESGHDVDESGMMERESAAVVVESPPHPEGSTSLVPPLPPP